MVIRGKKMDAMDFIRNLVSSDAAKPLAMLLKTAADALMSAEADSLCNAEYGHRSEGRTNSRNGYRSRQLDTEV